MYELSDPTWLQMKNILTEKLNNLLLVDRVKNSYWERKDHEQKIKPENPRMTTKSEVKLFSFWT